MNSEDIDVRFDNRFSVEENWQDCLQIAKESNSTIHPVFNKYDGKLDGWNIPGWISPPSIIL